MRKSIAMFGAAACLAACGQSTENSAANSSAATADKPKLRAAYCFFKDSETKGWKGSRDKSGNVVVIGKVYREDPRYKAILSPATVNGTTAEIAPTITQNDTGYAAVDNWWSVTQTIPNSQDVDSVTVKCGDETVAIIKMVRKK